MKTRLFEFEPNFFQYGVMEKSWLTVELNCPLKSLLVSEIVIDARGRNCPQYEVITVKSDQLVCDEGYAPDVYGEKCVDIDECATKGGTNTACAGIATCTNLPGTFVCKCDGYGDGYLVSLISITQVILFC